MFIKKLGLDILLRALMPGARAQQPHPAANEIDRIEQRAFSETYSPVFVPPTPASAAPRGRRCRVRVGGLRSRVWQRR
mgnify:CR=1 FL=1